MRTPANAHVRQSSSHDVGLVNRGDPAAAFLPSQSEGVVGDPEGIVPSDDLETLHDPGDTLKAETGRRWTNWSLKKDESQWCYGVMV